MIHSTLRPFSLVIAAALCAACGTEEPTYAWDALFSLPHSRAVADGATPLRESRLASRTPRDTLRLARWFGDSTTFARVTTVRRSGDRLLVADALTDPHLAVVDLHSGQLRQRIGRRGKGPREVLDPRWAYAEPGGGSRVWLYDYQNHRLSLLDLEAEGASAVVEERTLRVPGPLLSPVWVGDSLLSNGYFPNLALLVMDGEGKASRGIATSLPGQREGVSELAALIRLNKSHLAVDPQVQRVALAYHYESRVDVLDPTGRLLASARGPREAKTRYGWGVDGEGRRRFRLEEDNEFSYVAADGSERYVYALFCGTCRVEKSFPTLLHVFRWNGEFVGEIALDRPIKTFSVDPDDRVLYGVTEEPYPQVGEWPLPEWLRAP